MSNSQCININSPRIKKLSKLTGMHPRIIGAKVKLWQDNISQDKDALPTLKEFVSNTYDLKTRNAVVLYNENPEFKSLGDSKKFEDYVRLIENQPTVEGFKDFLAGEYWKIKDAENTAIRNRTYDLYQGYGLTEENLKESRKSLSEIAQTEANKEIKEEYTEKNTEGNVTTIRIVPSPERDKIKEPKNAYEVARKIAKRVNEILRHPMNNTALPAEARSDENGDGVVTIKYGISDVIFRANFDYKDSFVTPRLKKKLFEKKALLSLYIEGVISTDTFLYHMEQKGLRNSDLILTNEEVEVMKDLEPILLPKVLINGKLYEDAESANKARKEAYKPFNEETVEPDFSDMEFSLNTSRDPINIETYKEKRKQQIRSIDNKIKELDSLKRATGNYKKYKSRTFQLQKIKKKFEDDLENGDLVNDPLKVVKKSFEEDIKIIEEIQRDTNIENISTARDLLNLLKDNLEKQYNKKNYIFSKDATITDVQELTNDLSKKISELSSKQSAITMKFFSDIVDKRFEQSMKDLFPGKTKQEILDTLLSQIKNEDIFSEKGRSLGRSFTQNDPIGKIIRLEYEFSVAEEKAKSASLIQKIEDLKNKIDESLRKNGFQNWFQAFTRQTNKGDVELISKYSQDYKTFIYQNFFLIQQEAERARNSGNFVAMNTAYNKMFNKLSESTNFVEFYKLPEIAKYLQGTEMGKEISIDLNYANKVKEEIGEIEYNSLVERQIEFIEDFKNKKRDLEEWAIGRQDGASKLEDLTPENRAKLNQLIDTYNPFFLVKNKGNQVPIKIGTQTYSSPHRLEFNAFYPKRKNIEGLETNFFDAKFETIEKSPDLLEAWKTLEESTFAINSGFATSSLNLNKRSILYFKKGILDMALDSAPPSTQKRMSKSYYKNTIAWLRNPFSSYQTDIENDNIKLPPGVKSFKNEISQAWNQDLDFLANLMKYEGKSRSLEYKTFNFNSLSPANQESFLENFGIERQTLEKDFLNSLSKIEIKDLKKYTQQRVYDNQKVDMVKLYKMMIEQASLYKAKEKALKTTSEIIDPLLEDVSYYKNAPSQQKKKEDFKKKVLRNDRKAKDNIVNLTKMLKRFSKDGKIDLRVKDWSIETQNLNADQKRVVRIIRERLDVLRKAYQRLDEDTSATEEILKQKKDISEEIERLEQRLEGIGRDFNLKDIYEAIVIKLFIKAKLALNVWAYFQNLLQGRQQAYIHSGFYNDKGELVGDYTKQQYTDADNFLHNVSITKSSRVEVTKAHALISKLGVIQDGSDYEQKAERTGTSQKPEMRPWKKSFWRWMILTEIGEYYNQSPLVLAALSNYNMPDGKPMFTGKNFPYHEIKDGVLVLKDKYLKSFKGISKEQMIADYQDFSSDKAMRFTINLKSIVSVRNGDYQESGVIQAKKTSIGKSVFTFANWLGEIAGGALDVTQPNFLTGKQETGYITKIMSSSKSRERSIPLVAQYTAIASLAGVAGVSSFSSILAGIASSIPGMVLPVILGFTILRLAMKNRNKNEKSKEGLGVLSLDNLKLLGYNMTVGTLMPLINGTTTLLNSLSNKNLDFEKSLGLDYTFNGRLNEEEALAIYKASTQTNLLQFISMLTSMIMYGIASSIGGDEEDELKNLIDDEETVENPAYSEQSKRNFEIGRWSRLKYFAYNFLRQTYNDTGLTTNPNGMVFSLIGDQDNAKAFSPLSEYVYIFSGLFQEDVVAQKDSPYFGQSKFSIKTKKAFLPKPFHNITEINEGNWYLGMENMSYKYYNPSPLLDNIMRTDLKKDMMKLEKERSSLRTKIKTNIEDYIIEEGIEYLKETYNTIIWDKLPKEVQDEINTEIINPILDNELPSIKKYNRFDYDVKQKKIKE